MKKNITTMELNKKELNLTNFIEEYLLLDFPKFNPIYLTSLHKFNEDETFLKDNLVLDFGFIKKNSESISTDDIIFYDKFTISYKELELFTTKREFMFKRYIHNEVLVLKQTLKTIELMYKDKLQPIVSFSSLTLKNSNIFLYDAI